MAVCIAFTIEIAGKGHRRNGFLQIPQVFAVGTGFNACVAQHILSKKIQAGDLGRIAGQRVSWPR